MDISINTIKNFEMTRIIGKKIRDAARMIVYPNKFSSDRYVEFLRNEGIEIGEDVRFNSPTTSAVDVTRPSLVTIGDNVSLTRGTTILTHDYAARVIKNKYNRRIGSAGEVIINDNVYVGNNVTILKDVEIGKNSIISACSLVNKDIPANTVAGGVPAKKLMDIDEFFEKRKREQVKEAKQYAQSIPRRYNRKPKMSDFQGFHTIFSNRSHTTEEAEFDSFESFLKSCDLSDED